ncbi:hypothetical protein [Thiohalophilus thiocyanatoxydans]|uniref:Uncharacterized protein n=1 Tax=Thiohalophilus thiocyanatoxydans TaxID=381308 RepID=A0A4R8IR96_9GAMM|nr:hypothetical protein [Thiohalophilus thiocyanatoxydans]TDY02854.1 hypothetical protein EDC23_1238 [Thiohalophilus thiocyanatoxydans]
MRHYRQWISRQSWLIGLLFGSLLMMLLFPSHLHLHHLDDAASEHGHVVDRHFLTDIGSHGETGSDSTPLKSGPGTLVKKFSDLSLDVALLMVLVLLLPLTGRTLSRARKQFTLRPPRYYSLSPPLRAPPQY